MATAKQVLSQLAALAGEDEAKLGSNNTTVNRYFNAVGYAYCGYAIWYAVKKAGSHILDGCSNPAYVPTIQAFLEGKGWRVSNSKARAGDIFVYLDQHVGFVNESINGTTILSLEGNSTGLRATVAAAKAGTGASYEGIGYKVRTLTAAFKVYRPAYDEDGAATGDREAPPEPEKAPEPVKTTEDYVKEWQEWLGVDPDGKPGEKTLDASFNRMFVALVKAHPAKRGDKGDYVMCIQGMLNAKGYDTGGLDGDYGPSTEKAVMAYQKTKGLDPDGKVGGDTLAALIKDVFGGAAA